MRVDTPPAQIQNTDTVNSQGSQAQPSPQASAITKGGSARRAEAQKRFDSAFPNGYVRIPTHGTNLRCGLFAVRRMMRSLPSVRTPSIEDLLEVVAEVNQHAYNQIIGADGATAASQQVLSAIMNNTMFSVDQLDQVV